MIAAGDDRRRRQNAWWSVLNFRMASMFAQKKDLAGKTAKDFSLFPDELEGETSVNALAHREFYEEAIDPHRKEMREERAQLSRDIERLSVKIDTFQVHPDRKAAYEREVYDKGVKVYQLGVLLGDV